jgi:hypothetical protein
MVTDKDNNKDYIWGLMVLLALELTVVFNIYFIPTESILN